MLARHVSLARCIVLANLTRSNAGSAEGLSESLQKLSLSSESAAVTPSEVLRLELEIYQLLLCFALSCFLSEILCFRGVVLLCCVHSQLSRNSAFVELCSVLSSFVVVPIHSIFQVFYSLMHISFAFRGVCIMKPHSPGPVSMKWQRNWRTSWTRRNKCRSTFVTSHPSHAPSPTSPSSWIWL